MRDMFKLLHYRSVVLLAGYLVIVFLPLGLAYSQAAPRESLSDEVSSALAMVAFAMLLMEFLLSGRFEHISISMGIDRMMRFHQWAGRFLTIILLIHPFLYVTPFKPPLPWDSAGQLTLGLSAATFATGLMAWILLAVLIIFSIFRDQFPYRYETWRLTHGLGAALIAFLAAHHAIEAGRYSGHPYLKAYWFVMLGAAVFALFYVYVITPIRQLRHPYRVVSLKKIALKTWELNIAPVPGSAMNFVAGQFCWLTLNRSPFAITEHPFSISSCPADRPNIGFVIKEAGDFTNAIGSVKVDAPAFIDGPHGNLTITGKSEAGIALIAGGVGIAPIMGILRQLYAEKDGRPIVLLYGNRTASQIVYQSEFEAMKDTLDIETHHVLAEPPCSWTGDIGQLDERILQKYLNADDRARWLYVVCGPTPMIDNVTKTLGSIGVPARQIISEKFSYN